MIKAFTSRPLKRYWTRNQVGKINAQHVAKVDRILKALDEARRPSDMDIPGFKLHMYKEDFWSVWVTGNWRVIFRFDDDGHAIDVDYLDYH